jgi:exoribonuclease II
MVTDAMLMGGVAAARFCHGAGNPDPLCDSGPAGGSGDESDLASMYARRRRFKPTRLSSAPDRHAGLGLPLYTRATSPLRRYSDLLVHQQIRAELTGRGGLSEDEVNARVAEAEVAAASVRRGERLSNQHWKHVFCARIRIGAAMVSWSISTSAG